MSLRLLLLNGFNHLNQINPDVQGFIGPELLGVQSVLHSNDCLYVVFLNESFLHQAQQTIGWTVTYYYGLLEDRQVLSLGTKIHRLKSDQHQWQSNYLECHLNHPNKGHQTLYFTQWLTSEM